MGAARHHDTYFPMIERILAEEGVPDELKYLAVVESALNPRARSHAAAGGMWQFIRATGVKATKFYVYHGAWIDPNRYRGWGPENIRNDRDAIMGAATAFTAVLGSN